MPLPRAVIHPLAVTSERDVTRVITCAAVFPGVGTDVTARVAWFADDGREPVTDSQWMLLQPGVAPSREGTHQRMLQS